MYNEIFRKLGNIQEPVMLEVHPDNFDDVARWLKEAAIRNGSQWPLIHLQKNPHISKGLIIWMKNPTISIDSRLTSLQTPNSSPSTNMSSD